MQRIRSDEWDKHADGCFVFQALEKLGIRGSNNVARQSMTGEIVQKGECVSVDLICPSQFPENKNGPFLRLSDRSGWLFENMYGESLMKQVKVDDGLWSFHVDNYPSGIALRRNPMDRSGYMLASPSTIYEPMQKIVCDKKCSSNGVNYYRVQGTDGWVFDKRGSTTMLLPESKVRTGLFAYRAISKIKVRSSPSADDECNTSIRIKKGEMFVVDIQRELPQSSSSDGLFLRMADGSGWLHEKKKDKPTMVEVPLIHGKWVLRIEKEACDVIPLRQPMDRSTMKVRLQRPKRCFSPDDEVKCDLKVVNESEVSFYRIQKTNTWIFDKRNGKTMVVVVSEDTSSNMEATIEDDSLTGEETAIRRSLQIVEKKIALMEQERVEKLREIKTFDDERAFKTGVVKERVCERQEELELIESKKNKSSKSGSELSQSGGTEFSRSTIDTMDPIKEDQNGMLIERQNSDDTIPIKNHSNSKDYDPWPLTEPSEPAVVSLLNKKYDWEKRAMDPPTKYKNGLKQQQQQQQEEPSRPNSPTFNTNSNMSVASNTSRSVDPPGNHRDEIERIRKKKERLASKRRLRSSRRNTNNKDQKNLVSPEMIRKETARIEKKRADVAKKK